MSFFSRLFGSNEREIRKFQPLAQQINTLEEEMRLLSDHDLRSKTTYFQNRFSKGEELDILLPEAFAVVREAARRVIGQRHFDVQLLGGVALHFGKITEMKTGEGKTLTSTLAVYLNALTGKGVHVVTVNDYLARRDCNWMGAVYHFLGLSTSCIVHDSAYLYEPKTIDANEVSIENENLRPIHRREAYAADITYGTNNEFGFDYLRDNMVQRLEDKVQREFHYAIIDEVDSILIDEARTPLIISAPDANSTQLYQQFSHLIRQLTRDKDYTVDEKMKTVSITDDGISQVEKLSNIGNLYDPSKIQYVHHLEQALKAEVIFQRDKDYVVKDDQVIIVDDFTGRLMPGRRYSEGLHQALEAKEGVSVQKESRTLATVTFQNYFRMYQKLAGMTGTASTSAEEFAKVYKIEVVEIPTNKPTVRKDHGDVIYKTEQGKFHAIVKKIQAIHETGQPVLVGTIAIEKSEYLSQLLTRSGVHHEVLNAKNHEREALIVAKAGQAGSVTIATNMAGRGTDIKLDDEARKAGGLFILGTERHEARRIDNQLRGRSGRQGDPGESQFFVSLEDELMRRFGGDRLKNVMDRLGLPEDEPIQNAMISKMIESAQTKIEGFNFDIRKHVLEYDDVMNKQREVVYKRRNDLLSHDSMKDAVLTLFSEEVEQHVSIRCVGEDHAWDIQGLREDLESVFSFPASEDKQLRMIQDDPSLDRAQKITKLHEYIFGKIKELYNAKEREIEAPTLRNMEKYFLLQTIDLSWMNHLDEIEYLRQGIGLRGYGQRDPLIEYKREAYDMFSDLMDSVRKTTITSLFRLERIKQETPAQSTAIISPLSHNLQYQGGDEDMSQFQEAKIEGRAITPSAASSTPMSVTNEKVGRNDPCPCGAKKQDGSPMKYKHCHGQNR